MHRRFIAAGWGKQRKLIAVDDVQFFRSSQKRTRVVGATGEYFIRTTLKDLARSLDPNDFWHIHRSAIVRASDMGPVVKLAAGQYAVRLTGRGEWIPVNAAFRRRLGVRSGGRARATGHFGRANGPSHECHMLSARQP